MKPGVPAFLADEKQPCVICYDESKFAIQSMCCGAGAACEDCIINNYLKNSQLCMFCNTNEAWRTLLYNPVLWRKTMLSFPIMIKHTNRVFFTHICLLIWRTWWTFLLGAFMWSVVILVAKYIVDGGVQDFFDVINGAVQGLGIEDTYRDRWK